MASTYAMPTSPPTSPFFHFLPPCSLSPRSGAGALSASLLPTRFKQKKNGKSGGGRVEKKKMDVVVGENDTAVKLWWCCNSLTVLKSTLHLSISLQSNLTGDDVENDE